MALAFCPAEQRPRMSSVESPLRITTRYVCLRRPSAVCPSSSVLMAMPSMSEPLYVLFHSSVIDLLMSDIFVSWKRISAALSAL